MIQEISTQLCAFILIKKDQVHTVKKEGLTGRIQGGVKVSHVFTSKDLLIHELAHLQYRQLLGEQTPVDIDYEILEVAVPKNLVITYDPLGAVVSGDIHHTWIKS